MSKESFLRENIDKADAIMHQLQKSLRSLLESRRNNIRLRISIIKQLLDLTYKNNDKERIAKYEVELAETERELAEVNKEIKELNL